ncbi:cation transporter [Halocatena marina]|uniref:Cation transporter n=1 Tax=Halocatena marina TaxID=2934937 RepID=A0ABD5YQU0_9EURY|nr:cation transporter [Halocatena marina]
MSNLIGFIVELAGGLLFGSVALLSDALHMLFDTLAYSMAFGASYTVNRIEGGETWLSAFIVWSQSLPS